MVDRLSGHGLHPLRTVFAAANIFSGSDVMKAELHNVIVGFLNQHRILTLATSRRDAWPQATTVVYINEELILCCFVSRLRQKYANIRRDSRVSVAIASDFESPSNIEGAVFGRARGVCVRQGGIRSYRHAASKANSGIHLLGAVESGILTAAANDPANNLRHRLLETIRAQRTGEGFSP